MKIKSVAAVGAMGLGLGFASFIGAGTASAACGDPSTPPLERARCLTQSNLDSFATSTSPSYNLGVLVRGTQEQVCTDGGGTGTPECHNEFSGLGLQDQLSTFQSSVQTFLAGPVAPDGPPDVADPHPPGATEGPSTP